MESGGQVDGKGRRIETPETEAINGVHGKQVDARDMRTVLNVFVQHFSRIVLSKILNRGSSIELCLNTSTARSISDDKFFF